MFGTAIFESTLRKKHNLPLWHPKHEDRKTQTQSDVSYTLPSMKCAPTPSVEEQCLVAQAPTRLASQSKSVEPNPMLSGLLASFGNVLKIQSQIEHRVQILTREEIQRKYPG